MKVAFVLLLLAAPALAGDGIASAEVGFPGMTAADRLGVHFDPLAAVTAASQTTAPAPGTLQMPKFIVRARLLPTREDVMTDSEVLRLARKTYISPLYQVTFGPLSQLAAYLENPLAIFGGWHPSDAEANALARQQRRLDRLNELDSLMELESMSDPKNKAEFQEIRYQASTESR